MIYLDNNATTKLDPRVLEAMLPYLMEEYGNASSAHPFGARANRGVIRARRQIANLLMCEPGDIVFTSGATEAINLALKGIAEGNKSARRRLITVKTEHKAVLDTCRHLEGRGHSVTYLNVNETGKIDLTEFKSFLGEDTLLVSVMAVNNETGVHMPIHEICELTHASGAIFMTDATQAAGKIPLNLREANIDLATLSAHKFYGPKGIGALIFRDANRNGHLLTPLLTGGNQEKGFRSGTLNVPGIVGLGAAFEITNREMEENGKRIQWLKNKLESALLEIEGVHLNGHVTERLGNVSNLRLPIKDAAVALNLSGKLAVSGGSACSPGKPSPSHVLIAMGLSEEEASSSVRFSLGRFNTEQDIDAAIIEIKAVLNGVKEKV